MPAPRRIARSRAGFTLTEVMIALTLVAVMSLAVFAGTQTITQVAVRTAIRNEAERLLQGEAERMMSVSYGNFIASTTDETIYSSFRTTFRNSTAAALTYPTSGTSGRTEFTRRVVQVSSTSTSRTLRVEVQWQAGTQTIKLTAQLYRTQ